MIPNSLRGIFRRVIRLIKRRSYRDVLDQRFEKDEAVLNSPIVSSSISQEEWDKIKAVAFLVTSVEAQIICAEDTKRHARWFNDAVKYWTEDKYKTLSEFSSYMCDGLNEVYDAIRWLQVEADGLQARAARGHEFQPWEIATAKKLLEIQSKPTASFKTDWVLK